MTWRVMSLALVVFSACGPKPHRRISEPTAAQAPELGLAEALTNADADVSKALLDLIETHPQTPAAGIAQAMLECLNERDLLKQELASIKRELTSCLLYTSPSPRDS